jgi:hypothetical protein
MGRLFYDRDIGCAVTGPDAWKQAHRMRRCYKHYNPL